MLSFSLVAEALTGLIYHRPSGENSKFAHTPCLMMGEVSPETSPKNTMIQDMINSETISKNKSYNYMSIYIGNDLEDGLEALEAENASLRKYNEYHQVVHEIDHMSDLHEDSSFHKQSIKLNNYVKIEEWLDSSLGETTVIQRLNKKRPKLSNSNQTQNRRRYVNFENSSHFICSFNLNNPEATVCIAFRLNSIASGNNLLLNGIIGNSVKYVAFYKTHSGLGLLISTAYNGSYIVVANNKSSFIGLNYNFPSSKSNFTILKKWHVISVTWSNVKNLSNCWSNGEKLMTFNTGNTKGTDHCIIGNIKTLSDNSHLIGSLGKSLVSIGV